MKDAIQDIGCWPRWESPASAGWSMTRLEQAKAYADSLDTEALMIVAGGRVVAAWGRIDACFNVHSIRKSILSALIGIYEEAGTIDLETTLGELGIDDKLGLTEKEKLATVLDLLTARSGVYHPSGYETPSMLAIKPARGTAGPGTTWCYNSWDFNALGTIFRRTTGSDIFLDFADRIAVPCSMEDFSASEHGTYVELTDSDHPAYQFRLSPRDLARFGELFLRKGRFGGQQVVPSAWVETSTLPYSEAGTGGAYGYMWWVSRSGILLPNVVVPDRTYAAKDAFGHLLIVIPGLNAVVVHRVDTNQQGKEVTRGRLGRLMGLVLSSAGRE